MFFEAKVVVDIDFQQHSLYVVVVVPSKSIVVDD
jgi:hypothetical protein